MKFTETAIKGAYVIDIEPSNDERGFFARSWCLDEYAQYGLNTEVVQCGISYNWYKGTLRGMHYQEPPHAEAKTIRCTKGAVYDVILDIRPDSETYKQWVSTHLSADNRRMLYVPEGVAHGFLTLVDDTELMYVLSHRYEPASARGIRWDDPAFQIEWIPMESYIISQKDKSFKLWKAGEEPC